MKNIQISSPETDRKMAWRASVLFMIVAWLLLAGFLGWAFIAARPGSWEGKQWCVLCLGCLALAFIPIQLARYFRQMRTGNIGTIGVFNSRALSSCQSQSIKWWNYVFAFVVVFFYSCLFRVF